MRILFFIFIVFQFSLAAQTKGISQSFEAATHTARAQQYEQAVKQYRTTILRAKNELANDNFLARIHFNIGVCYYQLKNPAKAVEEFNEAIKLSRRSFQKAFYALGMAHVDLKNWREAKTAFRKSVKLKPNDGEAWFDLALVFLEEKDFDAAEKAFQNAIKYKSTAAADAHNNIGVIFALRSDFPAAENEFNTALIQSNGKSVEAKNNLQFCRLYKQNFNQNLLAKLEFSRQEKRGE